MWEQVRRPQPPHHSPTRSHDASALGRSAHFPGIPVSVPLTDCPTALACLQIDNGVPWTSTRKFLMLAPVFWCVRAITRV